MCWWEELHGQEPLQTGGRAAWPRWSHLIVSGRTDKEEHAYLWSGRMRKTYLLFLILTPPQLFFFFAWVYSKGHLGKKRWKHFKDLKKVSLGINIMVSSLNHPPLTLKNFSWWKHIATVGNILATVYFWLCGWMDGWLLSIWSFGPKIYMDKNWLSLDVCLIITSSFLQVCWVITAF